jgi:hypothetical protein
MASCAGAGVAQLVEQRFRKPQVAGSIPVAGSINLNNLQASKASTPSLKLSG